MYPPGTKQVYQAARIAAQRLGAWGQGVRITLLGNDTIVQDRRIEVPPASCQALFQSLRGSGWETIYLDPGATEADLEAWMECLISKKRNSYRSPKIVAGSLNLARRSHPPSVLTNAVAGYLEFFSHTQEAFSDLESRKPGGLIRAREIVCAIAARLAVGKELFEPINELKDFDDYTYTHAINVCVLSSALSRLLGAPPDLVNTVSLAALCHDLGKKEIPKEILNKEGLLDPEERRCLEKHPACGAKLLLDTPGVESDSPLLPVVAYQHHMGTDRSGYPRGPACLGGRKLHFASLVVAVADVYDALRTVRPYRPALSVAKACTILIGDATSGKLHREYVSEFFFLLKVLAPGRRVTLTDGNQGVILEVQKNRVLAPLVRGDDGKLYDLSNPSAPALSGVEEEAD